MIGLISHEDESAYRAEVQNLVRWCSVNNLALNTEKTKELIIDFRRSGKKDYTPVLIKGGRVEQVSSLKFLGIHIADHLTWTCNTTAILKKAHQRLFLLRLLKKSGLSQQVLLDYYRCTIESTSHL